MGNSDKDFNAWNPGICSDIPERLRELITLYRKENSYRSYSEAAETAALCGLKTQELSYLSIRRLIIHELLIRVTADLTVPDGPNYEDLGISLRSMASLILTNHVEKYIEPIEKEFEQFCLRAEDKIRQLFNQEILTYKLKSKGSFSKELFLWFNIKTKEKYSDPQDRIIETLKYWKSIDENTDNFDDSCRLALAKVIGGIISVKGRVIRDESLIIPISLMVFRNLFGGAEISRLFDPIFWKAVAIEGFRILPGQEMPIVMNTKGASASGKSTIRPQQRILSEKMNVPWKDFALISPDYWRKFLLDYETLGPDFKYGAMLTGHELEIIDKKLDLYMEKKALDGRMPHLLIDRFRFDSFIVSGNGNYTSRLLTRFGHKVFLFFIITSPVDTVERAWKRAMSTSRYKAVDDLLFHNIEAYTGIPELLFSWMTITDKEINFEFLDNSVPLGDRPKTIGFGNKDKMTILDLEALNNIDKFKEIDIEAKEPNQVFKQDFRPSFAFLKQCLSKISNIIFVERKSFKIYGHYRAGAWLYRNLDYKPTKDAERECLRAIGWFENYSEAKKFLSHSSFLGENELTLGSKV